MSFFYTLFKKLYLRYKRANIENRYRGKLLLSSGAVVGEGSKFEGENSIGARTRFRGTMGLCSYIGPDCSFSAYIGRFTSIAPSVRCSSGYHMYKEPFVSCSPVFYSIRGQANGFHFSDKQIANEFKYYDNEKKISLKIGNDCWIGEQAFFVSGIEVCDGAVVLARAVVTKDVPPYSIVGGVPASIVGYRYDEATIDFLIKTRWWNNDIRWFKDNWTMMCNMAEFKKYYGYNT